jgi:dTDP-4-dehydrorhamnose reductase
MPTPMKSVSRILIIGRNGQVGWDLCSALMSLGKVWAVDLSTQPHSLDLSQPDRIRALLHELTPTIIVNAAAYTAVDRAENESDLAQQINATAPAVLAEEAKRLEAILIHYSTDYVFDGTSSQAYRENDPPQPLNAYGASKLAGDRAIVEVGGSGFVLRTSWVYGNRGQNFLLTMQRLANAGKGLRVVADQIGAPTWSRFLAQATAQLLNRLPDDPAEVRELAGIYHLTAAGSTSWHGFAEAIFRLTLPADHPVLQDLAPIPSSEYPTPARRPPRSLLDCSLIEERFGIVRPDWHEMLRLCLTEQQGYELAV